MPPQATRSSGPIQPRLTASTKKKTTPSSVTMPPLKARAFAPIRSAAEIVRPQSNARVAAGGVAGLGFGGAGRGGGATGLGAGAAARAGAGFGSAAGREVPRSLSTASWSSRTRRSRNATRLCRSGAVAVGADGRVIMYATRARMRRTPRMALPVPHAMIAPRTSAMTIQGEAPADFLIEGSGAFMGRS